jgi:hypothetical protein
MVDMPKKTPIKLEKTSMAYEKNVYDIDNSKFHGK